MTTTKENFVCHGLVAVCCVCKWVRNDQGFWLRLDATELGRLRGLMTHGICLACVRRLYPELMNGYGSTQPSETKVIWERLKI